MKDVIIFPNATCTFDLNNFTDAYIEKALKQALGVVCNDLGELGISVEADNWNCFSVKVMNNSETELESNLENDVYKFDFNEKDDIEDDVDGIDKTYEGFVFDNSEELETKKSNVGGSNITDYSKKIKEVPEDSKYVKIELEDGKTAVIKNQRIVGY